MGTPLNESIHRFLNCDNFPSDAIRTVKEKMTTAQLRYVTCQRCKLRIAPEYAHLDWTRLSSEEYDYLQRKVVMVVGLPEGCVPQLKK